METVGDKYMLVSGLSETDDEFHAVNIAHAALDMLDAAFNLKNSPVSLKVLNYFLLSFFWC